MIVGVPDSKLKDWLKGKKYIVATDEGEAVGIAAGHYLATGERAMVFMGANGFANALEALTSLIIPYLIPIDFVIGIGREESWHIVMTKLSKKIINLLSAYDHKAHFKYISK